MPKTVVENVVPCCIGSDFQLRRSEKCIFTLFPNFDHFSLYNSKKELSGCFLTYPIMFSRFDHPLINRKNNEIVGPVQIVDSTNLEGNGSRAIRSPFDEPSQLPSLIFLLPSIGFEYGFLHLLCLN
jgi:hypothetical protein